MMSESSAHELSAPLAAPPPQPVAAESNLETIPLDVHDGRPRSASPSVAAPAPVSSLPTTPPPTDTLSHHGSSRHGSYRVTKSPNQESIPVEFTVAGEESNKVVVPSAFNIDLLNRDPQLLNQHLKVAFEEIFAEPHPTIFSFDVVWRASYQSFTLVKLWTYRIMSLICAVPAAVCWAIYFACMAFCHIWCCVPCFRQIMINVGLLKRFFEVLMDCCIAPVCFSCGKLFSSFRITVVKTSDFTDLHQV